MNTNSDYSPRISYVTYVFVGIVVVLAGALSWYVYDGFGKHIPEPIQAVVGQNYAMEFGDSNFSRELQKGESIRILACEGGQRFWVETSDHIRGLLFIGAVENWQAIYEQPEMEDYGLKIDNYINIGKDQMIELYLGRSFEENETNYWPALYCYQKGDTVFATYQLRMWEGMQCYIPTICYVADRAVALTSFSKAPFEGNINWLKVTPWAEWLYTTPFFHVNWDRPMISYEKTFCDSWWWIFRIPAKLVLLIIALIVAVFWVSVIMAPFVLLLICLVPLRYPFWHLSNIQLGALLICATLISCYFFMPFLLLNHGGFMTVITMGLVAFIWGSIIASYIQSRCEECRCVGYIVELKRVYHHSDFVTREDKEYDSEQSNSNASVYKIYKVTTERKYYTQHCECQVCKNYIINKNVLGESIDVEKELIRIHTVHHVRKTSATRSSEDNSSTSSSEKKLNYIRCERCAFYDPYGGSCKYHDKFVQPNDDGCTDFE